VPGVPGVPDVPRVHQVPRAEVPPVGPHAVAQYNPQGPGWLAVAAILPLLVRRRYPSCKYECRPGEQGPADPRRLV